MKPILFISCLMLAACGGSDPEPINYIDGGPVTYVPDSNGVTYVPDSGSQSYSTDVGSADVGTTYTSGSVPSSLNPFSVGHNCPSPVLSGSAEQRACFEEAQKTCPEGKSPSQTAFDRRDDGQYVISGYACA